MATRTIASASWRDVAETARNPHLQLLEFSKQILKLTKRVHAYAVARSDDVAPKTDA